MGWVFYKLLKCKYYFLNYCSFSYFYRNDCLHNISADALLNTHGRYG